jgi:hypothetical protein
MVCRGVALVPALHNTLEPEPKLAPVTVIWSAELPTVALVVPKDEIVGPAAAVTVKVTKFETAPPGFVTVIDAEAGLAARLWLTTAVNCVELK